MQIPKKILDVDQVRKEYKLVLASVSPGLVAALDQAIEEQRAKYRSELDLNDEEIKALAMGWIIGRKNRKSDGRTLVHLNLAGLV